MEETGLKMKEWVKNKPKDGPRVKSKNGKIFFRKRKFVTTEAKSDINGKEV